MPGLAHGAAAPAGAAASTTIGSTSTGTSPAPGALTAAATNPAHALAASTVLLPTGERLHSPGGGSRQLGVVPAQATGTSGLATLRLGGTTLAYPRTAAPYLGHELDPSLFTLPAGSRTRIPLTVTSTTAAQAAVPGLTVTGRTGATTTGYLDAAGARAFGAALAARYRADAATARRTGHWPHGQGMFAGVQAVRATDVAGLAALAPAAPAATAHGSGVTPQYEMNTLTLTVTGADGRRVEEAFVPILNTDDARRYVGFAMVVGGEARVSVPAGHYLALTSVWGGDDAGTVGSGRATVTSGPAELTVDLSGPAVRPSVRTPVPTVTAGVDLVFAYRDAAGHDALTAGFSAIGLGGGTGAPRVLRDMAPGTGTMTMGVSWNQQAVDSSGRRVSYRTADSYAGVPASLSRTIDPKTMARLDLPLYGDGWGRGGVDYMPVLASPALSLGGLVISRDLPARPTTYLDTREGLTWGAFAVTADSEDPGFVDEAPRTYAVGTSTVPWFKAPLSIQPAVVSPFDGVTCLSCRNDKQLALVLDPWTDGTPGRFGELVGDSAGEPVTHLTLTRDGRKVLDKDDYVGAVVAAPTTASTYRAHLTVDRRLVATTLATSLETDLTFTSAAADAPALPAAACKPAFATPAGACTPLRLLTTRVEAPVALDDTLPAATVPLVVRIGHTAGTAGVTTVGLEVRITGTETWTPLTLTEAAEGTWKAALPGDAYRGRSLDLRVKATDDAGGALVQSVTGAFSVAGA
ncbi:MAG: hypothetical protein U0Q15_06170 [Kineosporiaceae bacterium]